MLRPRIIPCLLVHQKGLVKTVNFKNPKYVGDPINAVRIFNEKQVDELLVADIDATVSGAEPDFALIANLANECRMPLCYSGGVRSPEHADRIIGLGVEKVGISSAAIADPELVGRVAKRVGNQSVVVVLDVKRTLFGGYSMYTGNGKKKSSRDPFEFAKQMEDQGAGEILINSIDRDGMMQGFDLPLITRMRETVGIPMTCLGGAGSLDDIRQVIHAHKVIGVAAGSLFVFKGKYRAVLINYPEPALKRELIR